MIITREGAVVLAWCIFLDHHWKPRHPPAEVIPIQRALPATVTRP